MLHPYQNEAVQQMIEREMSGRIVLDNNNRLLINVGILGGDAGIGKTAIMLQTIHSNRIQNTQLTRSSFNNIGHNALLETTYQVKLCKTTLVIAGGSIRSQWKTEQNKFFADNISCVVVENIRQLKKVNPFANFQQRKTDGEAGLMDKIAHLNARHFKFIFHHETFNGDNIYDPGSIYLLGDRTEKKLCDTCTGYFKNVIADEWTPDDYFKGFIAQADWVKAEYGNRKENVRIDERGVLLKCPKSTENTKLKTWGELKFGPGFLYGTVKVVAKLAQLRNTKTHSPTGIIHNLWLYQFNHPYAEAIPGHPYEQYKNDKGKQPYEIDIEIWSKIYSENWSGGAGINYSIVDYMRNENAIVKPGEQKNINGNEIDRLNNVQLNYPDKNLYWHDFFEGYHLYEIIWKPASVQFKIDGRLVATITEQMAKIPDEYAFLWLGSPIYQDGTYYGQNQIPFLPDDRFSHIRYISID